MGARLFKECRASMKRPARNRIDLSYPSVDRLAQDIESLKKLAELTQHGIEIHIKIKVK